MKVLLKQSIQKVGDREDIVDVKEGYARNFLIPQNLAEVATDAIIAQVEKRQLQREKERAKRREAVKAMLAQLKKTTITLKASADDDGTLYAAVSVEDIVAALVELKFMVTADDVVLDESIKKVGEHSVNLNFGEGVAATITVVIEKE